MTKKLALALLALVASLALGATAALAAQIRSGADPGITATSIHLGATSPLSGSASAYASVARGADAYFKYVNGRGGVNGRKITYSIVDDAYNPAQTVQATRKLVEQDNVFAIFNALGTEHNLAVRDYLTFLSNPASLVDPTVVAGLEADVAKAKDPVDKLRALGALRPG